MDRTAVLGFNMERQSARRRLVVIVYGLLGLSLAGCWFIDRLHVSAFYLYLVVVLFVNQRILGGYGARGLLKPFHGKGPRNQPMPSNLMELELYRYGNLDRGSDEDYRNDERELARRDRVHYQAYQGICALLALMWLLASWGLHPPRFLPAGLLPVALYCVAMPAVLLAITLPQAILLWTEPDFEAQPRDRTSSPTLS